MCTYRSPKDAPSLETLNIPEDTRLLFGGEVSLTDKSRKGILINRSKMSSIRFDPNYIYTFDLMQVRLLCDSCLRVSLHEEEFFPW